MLIVQSKFMDGYKYRTIHYFQKWWVSCCADNHQFKKIHRLYNKRLSHCTTFSFTLAFFSSTSLVQIKTKNNKTSLWQSSKPILNSFPDRKTDRFDCEILYKETENWIFNFWLGKVNNCMFFLNCCRQRELRFPPLISAHYLWLFTTFLFAWK